MRKPPKPQPRIDGLVDEIANQDTLKESIDLNTRMAAETNYMLGQMWRLNAAGDWPLARRA